MGSNRPPTREQVERARELTRQLGSQTLAARELNVPMRTLCGWLSEIGPRLYGLKPPDRHATPDAKGRIEINVEDGVILAGSDLHPWPGEPSTAHRAFVHFCKRFRKDLTCVVINGDAIDLPRVSRHPPPGWTRMPTVQEELEVTSDRLGAIAEAAGKVPKYWPWGNHDQRFEVYLASRAPELAGVFGSRLADHFPDWEPCVSVFVNNRPGGLVIKHRYKGGIHATHNNAVMSGRSTATGHLHAQNVTPVTDYNGTRYGVDLGCMADTYSPAFQYLEDNPRNWRSGFGFFRFSGGVLMPPELVSVIEPGAVFFRGEVIEV